MYSCLPLVANIDLEGKFHSFSSWSNIAVPPLFINEMIQRLNFQKENGF